MILLVIIPVVFAAKYAYQGWHKDTTINHNAIVKAAALLNRPAFHKPDGNARLFKFNPNNLPDKQWLKLGLAETQIAVIKHYEEKGGRFYSKQDVKKMYSLSGADYERLAPYIDLPEKSFTKKPPLTIPVELNTADSAKLNTIYGVGPAFARRIIKYRDRLGGFYSKTQLKEVYGLDADKYAEIEAQVTVDPSHLKKINVNSAEFDDLKHLPYITFKQMNAIIQYRVQHGDYTSAAGLENIMILDKPTINKIKPYLVFK